MKIVLSWPDKDLSPNARVHWAVRAKAAKRYKSNAYLSTLAAVRFKERAGISGRIKLAISFCCPDRRARDLDNLIASFKAGQDGIAAALKIDDADFECSYSKEVRRDFCGVIVEIGALPMARAA